MRYPPPHSVRHEKNPLVWLCMKQPGGERGTVRREYPTACEAEFPYPTRPPDAWAASYVASPNEATFAPLRVQHLEERRQHDCRGGREDHLKARVPGCDRPPMVHGVIGGEEKDQGDQFKRKQAHSNRVNFGSATLKRS